MRRNHQPCRVCGAEHQNPMSSSICSPCGAAERAARETSAQAEREAAEQAERRQQRVDQDYLDDVGSRLDTDMDRLIDIIHRRA